VRIVLAVEPDLNLCRQLHERRLNGVQVLQADYLEVNLRETLQQHGLERVRAVGNLPYRAASPILRKLLRERELLGDLTLMFQREVAERLWARPGTRPYGVLSLLTQRVAEVGRLLSLPPQAFRPRPKVHSALVRVSFKPGLGDDGPESVCFEELVKGLLAHRRKNIANNLKRLRSKRLTPERVLLALHSLSLDPARRAETLSVEDFEALSRFCAS
jgi:16S rRNA (adenine1518-N6/adenine1519-N6)-dimethyltransferase